MVSRRDFLKISAAAGAGAVLATKFRGLEKTLAYPLMAGLSDPALQPKFLNYAPNALAPGFIYRSRNNKYRITVRQTAQMTGLLGPGGSPVPTPVWGYGENGKGVTWPGRTFEVRSGRPVSVMWQNKLVGRKGGFLPHLLPVDESLHWCYSLPGYQRYSIAKNGVPIVAHLHGGHTRSPFDGNPEFFFSPGWRVRGPQWIDKKYTYDNDQPAGTLWYHDHALGITRLNVYAGLAGFYILRDAFDTGKANNPLGLPAYPYELAYAIQDRMFRSTGELFYPAFEGDPAWDDFIVGEGATPPIPGGPSALAEFFGDHMVVNGLIWPKEDVEPRNYRMRLLNGSDSRFLVIRFRAVDAGETDLSNAGSPLPFYVIGSDQGLAAAATQNDTLIIDPGARYDIVVDFSDSALAGKRVVMENIGGDAPFGGTFGDALEPEDLFTDRQTDRIMAFDVVLPLDGSIADHFNPASIGQYSPINASVDRVRKVALFEGSDEYGRLQPLLGVAEPTVDAAGNSVNGALPWHQPTTENPSLGATEIWEIYNATEDAHPVHLHLVHFDVLNREGFSADLVEQPIIQHNGAVGTGARLENIALDGNVRQADGFEIAPKDMVTAYPGEVTRIKATFDRPGRYVWHCHILSHEDHEMMRVLHVGPDA